MLQGTYLKIHVLQIAEYPGGNGFNAGRVDSGNGTGIDQPAVTAADIRLFTNMRSMAMAVTDKIVVSSAGKSLAVMRHVRNENLAPTEFQHGVLSVVSKQAVRFRHHAVKCCNIADVIAVYSMNGNTQPERSAQGIDADQVATVDDCLRPRSLRLHNGLHEGIGAIMTVGNDTDLHT